MPGMPIDKLKELLRERRAERANLSTVAEKRAMMEELSERFPTPDDALVESVSANGVPAEWVAAPGANLNRQVLYLHGGGYVQGSPNSHRSLGYNLSKASDARVLMLDYRLAPEHVFPAAVDDAVAGYKWMLSQGAHPSKIVIGGDSAGGGLTISALVAVRDAGLPLPAGGLCISPWTDLSQSGDSIVLREQEDPMLNAESLQWFADHYLGDTDPETPLASPIHADLSGLPPLLVQVGTSEVLYDDSTRLAEKAQLAGVSVTLKPWAEMVHVWHIFSPLITQGQDAVAEAGQFINARTS